MGLYVKGLSWHVIQRVEAYVFSCMTPERSIITVMYKTIPNFTSSDKHHLRHNTHGKYDLLPSIRR